MIKFASDLRQVGIFSEYSGFLHKLNWLPRYSWNVDESGAKHQKPNPL